MGVQKCNNLKNNTRVLFIELSVLTGHGPAFEHSDMPCVRTSDTVRLTVDNRQGQLGQTCETCRLTGLASKPRPCYDHKCVRMHQVRSNALGRSFFTSLGPFCSLGRSFFTSLGPFCSLGRTSSLHLVILLFGQDLMQ
jgi:hypothetical protein